MNDLIVLSSNKTQRRVVNEMELLFAVQKNVIILSVRWIIEKEVITIFPYLWSANHMIAVRSEKASTL